MPDLNLELNSTLVQSLRCPVCGAAVRVSADRKSLICAADINDRNPKGRAHLFDGGAGGYVPLSPRHSGGGDSKEAVRARTSFLNHGYYKPAS
ncbi:MAG: hypothetical protein IJX72_05990, partial [Clostridia bacterium]|nr:hypothetical protein [Clostridia bacterium]